jgi:hypothetical protein
MVQHLGDLVLGTQERAGEIDGDCIVPPGLGQFRARAALTERAGIVESDIEPAELRDGECDQGFA